jgi:hypothetical protein
VYGSSVDAISIVVENVLRGEQALHDDHPARRGATLLSYGRGVNRIWVMFGVALPLAAADLYVKASEPTEAWAYHQRSFGWLLLSFSLLAGMVVLTRIPSLLVAPAAGVLAGGLLGNSLSAAWNGMEVPNPLVLVSGHGLIAFNLADIWALVGTLLLVLVIGVWLIRNRALIPPTAEVRALRGRAFRRLFD